ncbi:hypothetical protein FSARC_1869 [Fusarium sarcochroum]|uniref:Uncharacterized protein n=1 Tax=Fusarium sarcochroum TaxID=1208366 RepID=A0A8H4U7X2_9HYPO|nr:hypothetical protein FSARC_1869 [Fusarium sarcochroum]
MPPQLTEPRWCLPKLCHPICKNPRASRFQSTSLFSARPSPTTVMDQASELEVRLSIDYGSSAIKAAYLIKADGQWQTRPVRCWGYDTIIRDTGGVDITASQQSLPNLVYFTDCGRMDIGLTDKNYPSYAGSKRAVSLKLFPGGEAEKLRQVLEQHKREPGDVLRLAFEKALAALQRTMHRDHPLEKREYVLRVVTLSIPEIYAQGDICGADIQAMYLKAAEDAGFPKESIRFETEAMSTAMYLIQTLSGSESHGLSEPRTQMNIADLGAMSWDVITIVNINGEFVQHDPPQGGIGGMGQVWAKLRQKFPGDDETFELIKAKCCKLTDFRDINLGLEVKVRAQELRAMFEEAWNNFSEYMQDWFKDKDTRDLWIVGGAPASNHLIQSYLREQLGDRGINASFPPHPDPTHAVCRGAITPWKPLDPVAILERSQIGFLVSLHESSPKPLDRAINLKLAGQKLESLESRFETVEPCEGKIQLWLYYSESGKALGKQYGTSKQTTNQIHNFERDEATLLDPINIKPVGSDSETIHFRFVKDTVSPSRLYLELYSEFRYTIICLEITRDRTRALLEQEESELSAKYASEGPMRITPELFDQVAIGNANHSAVLRHNGTSRIACLELGYKTRLLIRVPTPEPLSKQDTMSQEHTTETGYYCPFSFVLKKGRRKGSFFLTALWSEDENSLDVVLIQKRILFRLRLTWTCRNGILSVEDGPIWSQVKVNKSLKNKFTVLNEWCENGGEPVSLDESYAEGWEEILLRMPWKITTPKRNKPCGEVTQQPSSKRARKPSHDETIHASLHGSITYTPPPLLNPDSDRDITFDEGNAQLAQTVTSNQDTVNRSPCSSIPSDGHAYVSCQEQDGTSGTPTSESDVLGQDSSVAPNQSLGVGQKKSTR